MNSPVIRFRFQSAIFALIAGLLLTPLAQAAPLTDRQIQAVINIQKDVAFIEQEFPELDRRAEENHDMSRPVSSFLPLLDEYPKAQSRLEDVVEKHGLDSIEQWASVADRVYTSLMAIIIRDMSPQEKQMYEQMVNAQAADDAPEYMKAHMAKMKKEMQNMKTAAEQATEEDIQAVRPFLDQLTADNDE